MPMQKQDNTPLTVQISKGLQLMLWIVYPLFIAFMLFAFSQIPEEEIEDDLFWGTLFGVAIFLWIALFVWAAVIGIRWKLVLLEDHFEYIPSFGKTRNYSYSDLQKISLTRSGLALYDRQGKKLTTITNTCTNALEALEFFRAKGVPTDF